MWLTCPPVASIKVRNCLLTGEVRCAWNGAKNKLFWMKLPCEQVFGPAAANLRAVRIAGKGRSTLLTMPRFLKSNAPTLSSTPKFRIVVNNYSPPPIGI